MRGLGRPLPRAFYARHPVRVARDLLGRVLVVDREGERVAARIVEVEAYRGASDPASHAWRGRTERTAVMFGPPGHAYIYFTYGMHFCINVVTEEEGRASAVLIRALEAVAGLEAMRARRGAVADVALLRGPGNAARALGLTRRENGVDLTRRPVWIASRPAERRGARVAAGPRIGLRRAVERRWRFWLAGDPHVSGSRGANAAAEQLPR